MKNRKNSVQKDKNIVGEKPVGNAEDLAYRGRLDRYCNCYRTPSESDIEDFDYSKFENDEENVHYDSNACNHDLEAEYIKLRHALDLSRETHSLTKIETNLPSCLKYGFRSGLLHMHMKKFSPLSRGFQGPAVAVAAIATSFLVKPYCWNEPVIDQLIEDGDIYYSESYKNIKISDRRNLTILDLKRDLEVRKSHRIFVKIDDPIYAGTFRSETPKDLHIAKAIDLFFKKFDACVLTSPVLNVAIWKTCKDFNIFDAQARLEDCNVDESRKNGTAKLFMVQNLRGVLFIILEKSNVKNEPFVLYGVTVTNAQKLSEVLLHEEIKSFKEPQRRPSGWRIGEKFRATIQGSYHLYHAVLPQEFQGKGHLVISVAALIYSKLLSTNKWTRVILDVIFNQSNCYLMDLARVLGKTLDESFQIGLKDLLCDVILGVYTAKIKLFENVVPGEDKKAKTTMDVGIRTFFANHSMGIFEINKTFYAIWKEKNKFYFFDPFACDGDGFRVDQRDPETLEGYQTATSCVTMNSSVEQLMEIILTNTESKSKDPFVLHGLNVLYIKASSAKDGSDEKVVFREKTINRRSLRPHTPPSTVTDECASVIDSLPRPRPYEDIPLHESVQYPELMDQIQLYVNTIDECEPEANVKNIDEKSNVLSYKIVNPHKLILEGGINCLNQVFGEQDKGKQGLIIALATIIQAKRLFLPKWTSSEIDKIIVNGHLAHREIVSLILEGSAENKKEETDEANEKKEKNEQVDKSQSHNSKNNENFKSELTESPIAKKIDHLELSMLPKRMKIGDNNVAVVSKMNVIEGSSNPLANLGEALERYFNEFNEMILENKKLMYAICKNNNEYFFLNPYGSNKEGWRDNVSSAAIVIVHGINELVNCLYGLLECNDYYFAFHYVKISFLSDEDDNNPEIEIPETNIIEKYRTKFLPVTNDDVNKLRLIEKPKSKQSITKTLNVSEIEIKNHNNIGDEINKVEPEITKIVITNKTFTTENKTKKFFDEVKEPHQTDAPASLNLALITDLVKIECLDKKRDHEENLEIFHEKLKYKHLPFFLTSPRKNLCNLLDIKSAIKSIPSLLSRFSIDSKLVIKDKSDFPISTKNTIMVDIVDKSKLIKLPEHKYVFSKMLSSGLTPIRAIDEQYIRDKSIEKQKQEECRKKKSEKEIKVAFKDMLDLSRGRILPSIIPLGPCIATSKPKCKIRDCPDKTKRICNLIKKENEDFILKKLVCSTENLLLELIFPDFKEHSEEPIPNVKADDQSTKSLVEDFNDGKCENSLEPEDHGFKATTDENIGIINGSLYLEDRTWVNKTHYKSCYYAAILCILAKINVDVDEFSPGVLNRLILAANKIAEGTAKLRYKMIRCFKNINILSATYNIILKQVRYAAPDYPPDELSLVLKEFLHNHQTGIIVFENVAYAFWTANSMFYLFDPYPCDENGKPNDDGSACLMEICKFKTFLERIIENTGEAVSKPYRLYMISIAHLEKKKKRKFNRKHVKVCKYQKPPFKENVQETEKVKSNEPKKCESEISLIELVDWVIEDKTRISTVDSKISGFLPIKNFSASALDVKILENEITRPILAPLKLLVHSPDSLDMPESREPIRMKPYDRMFYENTVLAEPMDLFIMAWSQIYNVPMWSIRTIQGLFDACKDYILDSLLAAEDTTKLKMTDNLLTEFDIANYNFRVVFAPLHIGKLYATEGWNLAMSLEKIFDSPVYTGAILVCEGTHIGLMRKEKRYYAWWLIKETKIIRIIVSEDMEDYLRLLVKEVDQPGETRFSIRIITISYAKMFGPNCSDLEGLHESMMPSTSIPEIHRRIEDDYELSAVFHLITKSQAPYFILGSVALNDRDTVIEPRVKRCYFAALFAVMLKRDIIQNPLPSMIDKVLQLAENTYRSLDQPKYHTEQILKDVSMMDRTFDLRDCTSAVFSLQDEKQSSDKTFFSTVTKELKQFFKKHTSGVIQFSNCCYGFWYSDATCCYYYLDPYPCDAKGRRNDTEGNACLCIFSSVCDMASQMCLNRFGDTTGICIHRIHVESVNSFAYEKFQEDPMWIYLDFHWSYRHIDKLKSYKNKKNQVHDIDQMLKKTTWKNYLIEVPNLIYSIWGTIGSFSTRFGKQVGENQAAIGITLLAMKNLYHPSDWCSAVLDSAVICGDRYYNDSKKTSAQCFNKFRLSECLKVLPYQWNLKFLSDICGILYGNSDQPTLAEVVERALAISPYLLLQCKKKILTILQTSDAFYAVDSSWTGPPLFSENRGAIYAIRCNNTNMLVYVLTKMLNTNQKVEFSITPVNAAFKMETCETGRDSKLKILDKPAKSTPGRTLRHPPLVCGSITVPDEDFYSCYTRNLKLGLSHRQVFEDATYLSIDNSMTQANANLKTKNASKRKSSTKELKGNKSFHLGSISDFSDRNITYPKVLNFLTTSADNSKKVSNEMSKKIQEVVKMSCDKKPYDIRRSFIHNETRQLFYRYNADMNTTNYSTYKHLNVKECRNTQGKRKSAEESKSNLISISVEEPEMVLSGVLSTDPVSRPNLNGEEDDVENEIPSGEENTYRSSIHLNINN